MSRDEVRAGVFVGFRFPDAESADEFSRTVLNLRSVEGSKVLARRTDVQVALRPGADEAALTSIAASFGWPGEGG